MFFQKKNWYHYIEIENVNMNMVRNVPWKITLFTIVFSLSVLGRSRIPQKRRSVTTRRLFLVCSKFHRNCVFEFTKEITKKKRTNRFVQKLKL